MRNHTPSQLSQILPRTGETKHRAMTNEGECTPVTRWERAGWTSESGRPKLKSRPVCCAASGKFLNLSEPQFLSLFLCYEDKRDNGCISMGSPPREQALTLK